MNDINLHGSIPLAPIVVCKNEETAILVQNALHTHMAQLPPVTVNNDWPEDASYHAVVITPLVVLGQSETSDFALAGNMSHELRNAVNAATRLATVNKPVSVRNLATALGVSRRQAQLLAKEMQDMGLAVRENEQAPLRLLWGRWIPDAAMATAAGIEIRSYK